MNPNPHIETKEKFFDRFKGVLAPSEIIDIQVAYMWAKHAHRAQRRKETDDSGNPVRYFEHCRRAAIVAMDIGKIKDRDVIVSCLLHDTIEDTEDVTIEMIDRVFGSSVARTVLLLTKRSEISSEDYYNNIANDSLAIKVKLSDRIANFQTLENLSEEFVSKQVAKTEQFLEIIEKNKFIYPNMSQAILCLELGCLWRKYKQK